MDKKTDIEKKIFSKITLVTGGQRSGKSEFAESLALKLSQRPAYLATARIFDEEMQQRVDLHKRRREDRWINLEEPLYVGETDLREADVILLDCLTLLSTNWFFEDKEDVERSLRDIREQIGKLISKGKSVIIVTNEIGMGGVSENAMQRKFTDLQGWMNQYVASIADDVYLLVSGIPLKIKG